MSRDYKSRNSAKAHKNGSLLWLGLFVGYTLGLASAIGVWLYLSQAPSPFLNGGKVAQNQSSEKSSVRRSPSPEKQEKKTESNTNQTGTSGSRFDFYKICRVSMSHRVKMYLISHHYRLLQPLPGRSLKKLLKNRLRRFLNPRVGIIFRRVPSEIPVMLSG